MTTEEKVAKTILQEPTAITFSGEDFEMHSITMATMIKASAYISRLPKKIGDDEFLSLLFTPEHYENLAKAISVFVAGVTEKGSEERIEKVERNILADRIENVQVQFSKVLENINPSVFFSLITFLHEANMTSPKKTTASGQL